MKFKSKDIATAVGGQAVSPGIAVEGAAIDTRAIVGGELFVPIVAERDGHNYIDEALASGASAYLTQRDGDRDNAIVVEDTQAALLALGAYAVRRLDTTVIGITGSVGKTTTKDLLAAVLQADRLTHASVRSFNNDLGLPITVLNAPDGVEALVLEIGANARGEIGRLCELARPLVGVVTRVAPAHTLGFGDVDGVANAKSELVRALPAEGTAVLNADDERVAAMRSMTAATVVTFGRDADVRVRLVGLMTDLRPHVHVESPWGEFEVVVTARGAQQVTNVGAVVAAAGVLGVPVELMAAGLEGASLSAMRMDLRTARSGFQVIDDSYNANPASVEAALHALCALDARRRVAVLGPMAELGTLSDTEHRRIADIARSLDVHVLAVAAPAYGTESVPDIESAVALLSSFQLGDGDAILVKGSRLAGLEALVACLCQA